MGDNPCLDWFGIIWITHFLAVREELTDSSESDFRPFLAMEESLEESVDSSLVTKEESRYCVHQMSSSVTV